MASAIHLADKAGMEIVLAADKPLPKAPSLGEGMASWQAAWISALLHVAAIAALCTFFLPSRLPEAPAQSGFAIVIAQPYDAAMEQMLQGLPIRSARRTIVESLANPRPLSLTLPRAEARASSVPPRLRPDIFGADMAAQAPRSAAAPGLLSSAGAITPPPSGPSLALSDKLLSGLEARIRQAVQEAAVYPAAARIMRLQGRTQVRFDYRDGSAATIGVATSSKSPILDRAALAAVRDASLPRAPAPMGARTFPVLVWVDFHLVQQD